jgi:hypothetical protein
MRSQSAHAGFTLACATTQQQPNRSTSHSPATTPLAPSTPNAWRWRRSRDFLPAPAPWPPRRNCSAPSSAYATTPA